MEHWQAKRTKAHQGKGGSRWSISFHLPPPKSCIYWRRKTNKKQEHLHLLLKVSFLITVKSHLNGTITVLLVCVTMPPLFFFPKGKSWILCLKVQRAVFDILQFILEFTVLNLFIFSRVVKSAQYMAFLRLIAPPIICDAYYIHTPFSICFHLTADSIRLNVVMNNWNVKQYYNGFLLEKVSSLELLFNTFP